MWFILSKEGNREISTASLSPHISYISLVWGFRWPTVSLAEQLEADKEGSGSSSLLLDEERAKGTQGQEPS